MSTEQTQEKEITIEGQVNYDPTWFTIVISQAELRKRLKDGESLQDIADELWLDPDYSETESDLYYRELVINSVKG